MTVTISSGSASIYAGAPDASSHRVVASLSAGQSFIIAGVTAGEYVSVQSATSFSYQLSGTPATTTTTIAPTTTTIAPTTTTIAPTTTTIAPTTTTIAPTTTTLPTGTASQMVTWNCTGSPCPWGSPTGNPAMVWPSSVSPTAQRLGYTVTRAVYAPAAVVLGMTVTISSGSASIYAGAPDASSHRVVASLSAGQSFIIAGVTAGEYVSVQSATSFSYQLPGTPATTTTTTGPPVQPCHEPVTCDIVTSLAGYWRCTPNTPDCQYTDVWIAEAISWPSWAAYSSNARSGYLDRTAYGADGTEIYPYMGPWADGCQVEVVSGEVLVVEWERGTNVARYTELYAGEVYTINLVGSENSALIETYDWRPPMSVRLTNCNPQPL